MVTILPQYPHYLYRRESSGATRLANGDFVQGSDAWVLHSRCREETNGKGEEISTADVLSYRFASLVHMPSGTARIAEGIEVIVSEQSLDGYDLTDDVIRTLKFDGTIRIKALCAKFDVGRLHCRLWL